MNYLLQFKFPLVVTEDFLSLIHASLKTRQWPKPGDCSATYILMRTNARSRAQDIQIAPIIWDKLFLRSRLNCPPCSPPAPPSQEAASSRSICSCTGGARGCVTHDQRWVAPSGHKAVKIMAAKSAGWSIKPARPRGSMRFFLPAPMPEVWERRPTTALSRPSSLQGRHMTPGLRSITPNNVRLLMKEYFFLHLHFKVQLWIFRPLQRTKTPLLIFPSHLLSQALVVYEHANIYSGIYALHPVALATD